MATRLLEKNKWTKDGRKWVFYTWVPTLTGKRKKYTSRAYHTKKEALIAEREFIASIGNYTEDINMTFKELYTAYYSYQQDKVKATTLKTYRDRMVYMGLLDNVELVNLDWNLYQKWRNQMNALTLKTALANAIF